MSEPEDKDEAEAETEMVDTITFEGIPAHAAIEHDDGTDPEVREVSISIAPDAEDVTLAIDGGDCLHLDQFRAFDIAMALLAQIDAAPLVDSLTELMTPGELARVPSLLHDAKSYVEKLTADEESS